MSGQKFEVQTTGGGSEAGGATAPITDETITMVGVSTAARYLSEVKAGDALYHEGSRDIAAKKPDTPAARFYTEAASKH